MKHQLAESEVSLNSVPDFVLCRPAKSNWIGVGMLLVFAAMLFSLLLIPRDPGVPAMTPDERWTITLFISALASPFILGAGWLKRWIQRGAIIADNEKILWRQAGKSRVARWEDVSDYYLVSSGSTPIHAIETSSGTLKFAAASWTNAPELADFVQAHAHNAKMTEWQKKGARLVDPWPRTFGYQTFENRWFLPVISAFSFGLPLPFVCAMNFSQIWRTFSDIYALYGWPSVVVGIVALSFMPFIGYIGVFQWWRDARRRRNERIEATPDGILWTNGAQTIDATWDEVRAFRTRPTHQGHFAHFVYVVETERGEFSFTRELRNSIKLKETIETHATHAKIAAEIGSGASGQPIMKPGGARVYHYRTVLTHLLVGGMVALSLLPLLASYIDQPLDGFTPAPLFWTPLSLAIIAAGWWRYRLLSVRVDESGLTQTTLRGQHHLRWEQIEKYFLSPQSGKAIVEGTDASGQKVQLSFSMFVAGYADLREEIERRAINSSNRSWPDQLSQAMRSALPSGAIVQDAKKDDQSTLKAL